MDSLDSKDIIRAGIAGVLGFVLAFYVMKLEFDDSLKVAGITATARLGSTVIAQRLHEGGGWCISI
jgi:hypothetical protein